MRVVIFKGLLKFIEINRFEIKKFFFVQTSCAMNDSSVFKIVVEPMIKHFGNNMRLFYFSDELIKTFLFQ